MKKPQRLYQYLAAFTVFISLFASGLIYAWTSPSIPKYLSGDAPFTITEDEGSWIVIMELLAPMGFCFIGAYLINKIGRKKTIILGTIPYFAAWLTIIFARSAIELCIARFFAGISDGIIFTVVPIYIGEISDSKIRGLLGSSMSAIWIFGALCINIIGIYFSIITTAIICSVVPIIFIVLFMLMPDSPYYFIMKNEMEDARKALVKFKGTVNVDSELKRLQLAVSTQKENFSNSLELFTKKSNLKALAIIMILRNCQQMSGVAAISMYTLTIFHEAGDFISPFAATILYVSTQCAMISICSLLADKAGRRPLLIISLIGSIICLSIESIYFYIRDNTDFDTDIVSFIPVVALIGYVITFNLGLQAIPLLFLCEVFPTNVKGLAACVAEVYFCIMASTFSKFFQISKDSFGIYAPFLGFSICSLVNLAFLIRFVPETKGKSLEEIQEELGARRRK